MFDYVCDIDIFMRFVDYPRACVQAGGAAGVWPYRYSMLFEHVHTFEPMPANLECLRKNIEDADNVTVHPFALSDRPESGRMAWNQDERDNYGAAFFRSGDGEVRCVTVDSLCLDRCDLLQLDIEGRELEALKGASDTIGACRPVIVIEEKRLAHEKRDYRLPRSFLKRFGYEEVGRIHRDVIFKC